MENDCPKEQSYFVRILLCINVHRGILMILHLILLWIDFTIYMLGWEICASLTDVYFMIVDLSVSVILLKVTGITMFAGTIFLGILGLLTGIRILYRLHILVLTFVAAFLALFLCVFYVGIDGTTLAEANERYTKAFEMAKRKQDIEGINYVMKVERTLKCCGFNSSVDYEYGVLESCCLTIPPCRNEDIHKVGCAEALDKRLGDTMSNVVSVLSVALIYIVCLLVYLFFFCYLLRRKKVYDQKNVAQAKNEED